jgi:hypothetical protein
MRWKRALAFLLAAWLTAWPADGGHEWPIYPSFYPSVIRILAVDPAAAARLLLRGEIHAFVGDEPAFDGPPPPSIGTVDSLGAFVTVSVDPPDCARLWGALHDIADHPGEIVFHPYPVTPFHADYLEEADLAASAVARARAAAPAASEGKIRKIDAASLLERAMIRFDGWSGPPWAKSGWYMAYQLLADALPPAVQKRAAAELVELEHGGVDDLEEQYSAERALVSLLTGNCRRAVAGYTIRREAYDNDYSTGIENIASDSIAGLDSPVFIRTAKLKDYPWNGTLQLGFPSRPVTAWNPVAGFTDPAGRLIWSVLSDPAGFPNPYGAGWELDRVANVTPTR